VGNTVGPGNDATSSRQSAASRHPEDIPMATLIRPSGRRIATLLPAVLLIAGCASSPGTPSFTYAPPASAGGAAADAGAASTAPSVAPPVSSPSAAAAESQPAAAPTPGSSAGPIGIPAAGTAIYVSEWSVGLPTSMLAGQANFSITNIGTIQHEQLVFKSDLPPSAFPVDNKGNIIEDGPGITLVSRGDKIDPGKTQARVVDLTQPGTYLFVCNIPGHFKAGMYRVVTVTPPTAEQAYIPAALSEWHVAVPSTIKAGTVNLEAANFGTIQHELLVFKSDLAPSAFPIDKNGDIVEDGPGINLVSDGDNIDPGKTQTRTVDLTQPGTYLFVCNIPGHFKAGMFSVVTVTP
jgi:uncharacterized cupredoxin-like copper-binding protein